MKHIILIILLTIGIWAQKTGVPYVSLEKSMHTILGTKALFVLDGNGILSYDEKQNIHLWDLKTGRMDKCLTIENSSHKDLLYSNTWFEALTASNDLMFISFQGKIDVWDIATWKKIKEIETPKDFTGYPEHIELLHVDRKNNKLIGAGYKRNIMIWNLPDMKLEKVLRGSEFNPYEKDGYIPPNPYRKGHEGDITDVSDIVDNKYIFSISWMDQTLRKWDIESGEEVDKVSGNKFHRIKIINNGKDVMASSNENLIIYSTSDLSIRKKYGIEIGKNVNTAIIAPNDTHWYTTGDNGMQLKEWDMKQDQVLRPLPVDQPTVLTNIFKNGKYLTAGTVRSKRGVIYRVNDFKEVLNVSIIGHCGWIVMTPEGYFNASEDAITSIRIKDANGTDRPLTPQEIKKFKQPKKIQAILNDIISNKLNMEK